LVVAAAGRLQHEALVDRVGAILADFDNGIPARGRGPAATHPGKYLFPRDLEQVHLCLGTKGVAAGDPRRYGATLLQLILGGNMSSRLFQVVREQLGLAYNIYSFLSFFSDTGLLGIAAGVSRKNLAALLAAVTQELKKLKEQPVLAQELGGAQEYLKGSIYLHAEDCDQRMMRLAKNEINFGHYIPLEEIIAGLMEVTSDEIQELAQEFFRRENWGLTLSGPVEEEAGGMDF
jgi:predicted Zn-dependent peptidase